MVGRAAITGSYSQRERLQFSQSKRTQLKKLTCLDFSTQQQPRSPQSHDLQAFACLGPKPWQNSTYLLGLDGFMSKYSFNYSKLITICIEKIQTPEHLARKGKEEYIYPLLSGFTENSFPPPSSL